MITTMIKRLRDWWWLRKMKRQFRKGLDLLARYEEVSEAHRRIKVRLDVLAGIIIEAKRQVDDYGMIIGALPEGKE